MDQFVEFLTEHYIAAALWIGLFIAFIHSLVSGALSKIKEIGTHEATLLINKQDAYVLDIRPQADFKKGHILGAKQIAQEKVSKGDFKDLEKVKDKPIIVVCAMGVSAKRTAGQLLKAEFSNVNVLKGGMNAWSSANLPIAK